MLKLPRYYLWFENKQYVFTKPIAVLKIANYTAIERYLKQGYWVAGYFAYETPQAHLGVFRAPQLLSQSPFTQTNTNYHIAQLQFSHTKSRYDQALEQIKTQIKQGETYQLNFTGKFKFRFTGNPIDLYQTLLASQPVPYPAYCKLSNETIVSLSPELFFEQQGNNIVTRPMKGTSPRGYDFATDRQHLQQLRTSRKQRAENIMIVDLLRNDLSKICIPGSVTVPKLFTIERYRTLFQLTSTVTGTLKQGTRFTDIMTALFPNGSVTGAPKRRTMELISALETKPRGVYCGALGFVGPHEAQFNLPIRTVYLKGSHGELGVGSGITYDSKPEQEYQECLLKAKFLTHLTPPFQLIETLLWDKHYVLLPAHLQRLKQSAKYFNYPLSLTTVRKQLRQLTKKLLLGQRYKMKVLVDVKGNIHVMCRDVIYDVSTQYRVTFSQHPTHSSNVFLYHKTTNRKLYNTEYKKYAEQGYVDVLFCNERGEVTEGAISNIIIKKRGQYYTPPVSCGLLAGTYRQHFMTTHNVTEKILTKQDVLQADQVYICNSVRGLIRVKLMAINLPAP